MPKFLVDVNLPYKFALWNSIDFIHQYDLGDECTDEQIWLYAKSNDLSILTKDADFSNKIIFNSPPPRVIHFKIGNMKFKEFYLFVEANWHKRETINSSHKLTNVFLDRIEGIE